MSLYRWILGLAGQIAIAKALDRFIATCVAQVSKAVAVLSKNGACPLGFHGVSAGQGRTQRASNPIESTLDFALERHRNHARDNASGKRIGSISS
jgi:hypothetical protein